MSNQRALEQISETVGQIANLLERYKVKFWAATFKETHEKLERAITNGWEHDISTAIRTMRSWYGGMGSFNDLIISNLNRDEIAEQEETSANKKLQDLSSKLYSELEAVG